MVQASSPSLQSLVDETLAHVPTLAHAVYNGLQDELKSRLEHHLLLAGWSKRRTQFASDLEDSLTRLLTVAREGRDPLHRDRPAPAATGGDFSFSLVDESQALKDVAIAHVITAVEDHTKAELHQLSNFFAALRGIARPLKNDNPLRAALFAHALSRAIEGVDLDAEGRYALMRLAALPLARALQPIYARLCQELRQAQLSGLLTSHGSAIKESDLRLRQFKSLSAPPSQNATLDQVAMKLDLMNTRAAALSPAVAAPAVAPGPSAPPRLGPGSAAPGTDLLSRLYDQILSDDRLQPPLKVLMGRLQVAIVRLSREDGSLLRRQDHPTWQLLNRIAAHGAVFQRPDDAELRAFLQFLERVIQPLMDSAHPSALQFQQALTEVDAHIRAQAEARGQRSALALERLDREQRRQEWQRMLRDQLQHQLDDAQAGKLMRRFLLGPWVEVIAHAMVQHGRDAPEAATYVELVDALLHSVQPQDEASRQRLRGRLPALVQALGQGMDSIALPPMQRQAFLDELMRQHGRVLRGLPAVEEAPPPAVAPQRPPQTPEEVLQQLLDERESQLPSRWAHERVDRGQLPTVPVALYSEERSPHARAALQDWIGAIQIGGWYHLFLQSEWITAQIAWISDSRQMFLFIGQMPEERHSMTRGALEQLVANGLITHLDEEPLLQRAIGTLMMDLDRAS